MAPQRLPGVIERPPLRIRLWRDRDAAALGQLIAESLEHLAPWMAWAQDEPLSERRRLGLFARWHRYWESGEGAVYGVFVDDVPIGGCGLHRRVGPGGLELAYWLGVRSLGRGWATITARALIEAAFGVEDVDHVEIHHASSNTASASIPERLGFTALAADGGVSAWRLRSDDVIGEQG